MINYVDHLLVYLLDIFVFVYLLLLRNDSLRLLPTFNWVVFLLLSGRASLYIMNTSHFSDICIINIVSHSVACLLIF